MRTKAGYYYVGPNNGVFSYVAREQGVAEFAVLQPARINPRWKPGTFDGRDLFSPAGAILATSQALDAVGEPASPDQLILLPEPELKVDAATHSITAVYLRTDEPYGNVWTNISSDALTSAGITLGSKLRIECGKARLELPFVTSFGHVEKGAPLAYLNSSGMLAFAINMGDFRKQYDLNPGATVRVQKLPADLK
jgi:S-adenosylmethionine hydrolase